MRSLQYVSICCNLGSKIMNGSFKTIEIYRDRLRCCGLSGLKAQDIWRRSVRPWTAFMLDLSGYVVIRSEVSMGKNMEEHRTDEVRLTASDVLLAWHGRNCVGQQKGKIVWVRRYCFRVFYRKVQLSPGGCKASSKEETCRSSERFVVMKMGDG